MTKTIPLWWTLLLLSAILLSGCGAGSRAPTPTPLDPNLIAAQAIATFAMGLTQTAQAQPTPTFTATPEPTATPTFAPLVLDTPTATAPAVSCLASRWIKDLTYDDTVTIPVLQPGEQFVKKWLVQNTGTCPWKPEFKVAFAGIGIPLGGQTTPLGRQVGPGEQVEIAIAFVAPPTPGEYQSYWKLQDDRGAWFGTYITATIRVAGAVQSTATETPTPPTPTATPTP